MKPPPSEVYFTTVCGTTVARATSPCEPWLSSHDNARAGSPCHVSVVFSFWNEADVLPELIRRCRAVFDGLLTEGAVTGYELIFVNDASTDESEAILRYEAQVRDDIRLINMSRNFGVSPCVLAGMEHASGDAVIYLDADLQDPPEVIPELIAKWQGDPEIDVVHTVRRARLGESRLKKLLTRIGYGTLRAVSSIDLPYEAGDFKLLSRRAVDQVVQFREKRPFMRGLVCSIGFKQETVYYERQARELGNTKFPVLGWKVIRNFLDSAVISFSDVPLKLAGALGLACGFAGAVLTTILFSAWCAGFGIEGWAAALAGVLLVGGMQLFCTGILGSYLGAVYFETKRRPNYIVKSTLGFAAERTATSASLKKVTADFADVRG